MMKDAGYASKEAEVWLERYINEIGRSPTTPEFLRAFVINRGGELSFSFARNALATLQSTMMVSQQVDASSNVENHLQPVANQSNDSNSYGRCSPTIPVVNVPQLLRSQSAPTPSGGYIPRAESLLRAKSADAQLIRLHANDRQLKDGRHPFTDATLDRLVENASKSRAEGGSEIDSNSTLSKHHVGIKYFGIDFVEPTTSVGGDEKRMCGDGKISTKAGFIDSYGAENGAWLWDNAHPDAMEGLCQICFEKKLACFKPGGTLCVESGCEGLFCSTCLKEYYEVIVAGARYAVPFMRCPSCKCFIRTSLWQKLASATIVQKWQTNASELLTLRCIDCDDVGSLLFDRVLSDDERTDAINETFAFCSVDDHELLLTIWHQFSRGESAPEDLLNIIVDMFGDEDVVKDKIPSILRLIEDLGRRAVLQLASLRRWPKTTTFCCNAAHCFKCKVGTHHEGITCEEVQRRQMEDMDNGEGSVQFCPGCGVATLKTEGCNHMICLCGEDWTWDGREVWVNEWEGDPENSDNESNGS